MVKEIDSKKTKRALAFELWMKAPMPMITLFKTLDVSTLLRVSHKYNYKINMLICWCIGKAASHWEEFYMLPVGDKLLQYDGLAISTVVKTHDGGISTCDIPFTDNLEQFNAAYIKLTSQVYDSCETHNLGMEYMVIGTSALAQYDIDGAVNIYAGFYNNPFVIWGKIRRKIFCASLPISFQFHHTQLDGIPAAEFLEDLQRTIRRLNER
ncbi:MAG: CatA-like O-acetyltransferase, family 2 [Eubacteriales bacterium]|nr:CatA-like O-acetyltransferase, family 2 [Eubacteriales bacterium]